MKHFGEHVFEGLGKHVCTDLAKHASRKEGVSQKSWKNKSDSAGRSALFTAETESQMGLSQIGDPPK